MPEVRRMAELGSFSETAPKGALAEAAARFERVANVVKDQQLARTKSGGRQVDSESFILSPDEAWSKKYMTQCIGPVCTVRPTAAGAAALPKFVPEPKPAAAAGRPASRNQEFAAKPPAKPTASRSRNAKMETQPIGSAIGKPVRRRSWLGRLIRGS